VVRTTAVGAGPVALAIDERAGRVFVANGDGDSVSELDAASGRLIRTVAAGNTPLDVAVDQRTGRVLVVDLRADGHPALPPPPSRWDRLRSAIRRLFGGSSQQSPPSTTAATNGAVSMLVMPT